MQVQGSVLVKTLGDMLTFPKGRTTPFCLSKEADTPQAIDTKKIADEMGLLSIVSTSEYDEMLGLTTKEMAEALSALDVLVHASSQEGFGIIQVEAQALGVPVVGTQWGAMQELNANPGLLASVEQVSIEDAGGKIGIPNRKDIAGILETLYQTRRDSATRKLPCQTTCEHLLRITALAPSVASIGFLFTHKMKMKSWLI